MNDEEFHNTTRRLLTNYLSPLNNGRWSVQDASIKARAVHRSSLPAGATATRLLIEEPHQGWSVAVEVVRHDGKFLSARIEKLFDDRETLGAAGVRAAYFDWLRSL